VLQADAAAGMFQGYWPSSSPVEARTRVRGLGDRPEAASASRSASSARTPSGSSFSYGETASGRQKVTNLRLPGQYDERLFGSVGLQGPYYNWNRWYLPGVGRYLELDPIALAGGFNGAWGPDWYTYAGANPLRWIDRRGLSYEDYLDCVEACHKAMAVCLLTGGAICLATGPAIPYCYAQAGACCIITNELCEKNCEKRQWQ
jgi:RHS repeat-associated protein